MDISCKEIFALNAIITVKQLATDANVLVAKMDTIYIIINVYNVVLYVKPAQTQLTIAKVVMIDII